MGSPPPLPAPPVSALEYYEAPNAGRGTDTLRRRLGAICLAFGILWLLTHGFTVASALPAFNQSLRSPPTLTTAFWAWSIVFFLLAIPLTVGGALSLASRPTGAARVLLLIYSIGTLTVGVLVRIAVQLSYGVDQFFVPRSFASFASSLALITSLPAVLLIVLNAPSVRAAFR